MQSLILWLIVTLILTGLTMVSGYRTKDEWDKWRKSKIESTSLSGELLPSNKPTPTNACGKIPSNAIAIFLGNSVAYSSKFPHTVIKVVNQDLLTIDKNIEKITISARFFSRDGKIVAELKNNKFYVNPNNYFRLERPNNHTLKVYDQEAQEVLNVEFINRKVIKLLGIFYFPNRSPVIIKENVQILGGIQMSNNCFGENNVDIHLN